MSNQKFRELPSFQGDLARRLRELEKQFQNRAEAAKAAGVVAKTYQSWVDGRSVPSVKAMAHLAKATNTPLDWIAFGTGESVAEEEAKLNRSMLKIDYLLMDEINRKLRELYDKYPKQYPPNSAPAPYTMYWTYNDLIVIEDKAARATMLKTIISTYERSIIESKENDEQVKQETPDDQDQSSVG